VSETAFLVGFWSLAAGWLVLAGCIWLGDKE